MRISQLIRQAVTKTIVMDPYVSMFDGLKDKGWVIKIKSKGQITAVFEHEDALPAVITFTITIANEESVDYRGMAQLDATWPDKWKVQGLKDAPVQEPYSGDMVELEPELFGFWPQDREKFLASAKMILKRFEDATPQKQ